MHIKYQYTYFISSFEIEEKQYDKYILKLLKNKNLKLKVYNNEKNKELNQYFSKEIKNIMFKTMEMSKNKQKELEAIKPTEYKKILKIPSVSFEYIIENETQAKMGQEDGTFFKIDKIELICFKTGICFILIKTFLEDNLSIQNILDFNYKFKQSNLEQEIEKEQINIQTNEYKEKIEITQLLQELTGKNKQDNIYTYSYLCVDGEDWNKQKEFELLQTEVNKLANVLPSNSSEAIRLELIEKSNYAKIGVGKTGTALITNSLEAYNCAKLPFEYENQYLYTLILVLYEKLIIERINKKIKTNQKIKEENKIFVKQITKEEIGIKLYEAWQKSIGIREKFLQMFKKYNEIIMKKNKRNTIIIWGIIGACIITNIINIIILLNVLE